MNTKNRQQGFMLVVVLWVVLFLSVMAFELASNMRLEARISQNVLEQAKAYFLARSGFDLGMAEIDRRVEYVRKKGKLSLSERQEETYEVWALDGRENTLEWGQDTIRVRIFAEDGKIDLNTAPDTVLRKFLETVGMESADTDILLDSIKDWKDSDNLHHFNGAEDDYYEKLDPPYRARNGNFETVEELLLVRGMSEEILYGELSAGVEEYDESEPETETPRAPLRFIDCITVDNPNSDGKINVNFAPREVLRAIPFLGEGLVERIVELRESRGAEFLTDADYRETLGDDIFNAISNFVSFSSSPTRFTLYCKGEVASGAAEEILVLVNMTDVSSSKRKKEPYQVLRWLDSAI